MRRLVPLLIVFFAFTQAAEASWVWPVSGEVITPYRNGTDPYANGQHRGIDIAAPVGTPVVAAGAGEVRFAGTAGSSGLTISIRTGDGYDTSYLHLSSVAVRAGAHVSAGDRIGAVGMTGVRSAPAPHLHFGVRDAGTRHDYHDPLALLPPAPPAGAPDSPPPAPLAAPQPAPPPAAPVAGPRTAPGPREAPQRRPLAAPRRLPHLAPRHVPHVAPRHLPPATRAPRAAPRLGAVPAPQVASHGASAPQSARRTARGSRPASQAHSPLGSVHPALPDPHDALHASSPGDSPGGLDIGWVVACGALLLAGGLLGVNGDRNTGTSRRIRALLRPLVARR